MKLKEEINKIALRQARLTKNISQEELAFDLSTSQRIISNLESTKSKQGPTWRTIVRLCNALGIMPNDLAVFEV